MWRVQLLVECDEECEDGDGWEDLKWMVDWCGEIGGLS